MVRVGLSRQFDSGLFTDIGYGFRGARSPETAARIDERLVLLVGKRNELG